MTEDDNFANDRMARVRSSMLWAAWADALGFISEMTTASNLMRRTGGRQLTEPFAWSRQVGGRSGIRAELPAGTYSDDTQLRLCTSRSISSDGFDVEAFAKVELSVWPSYALGGGRASRAAAASIGKQQSSWAANFFRGWQNSGGNGAAMRIQPHVFAAKEFSSGDYLDDVIRNAVVTHGHPRGIVGATLHAASVAFVLDQGRVAGSKDWPDLLATVASAIVAFDRVEELGAYWLPQWEASTRTDFRSAWYATLEELDGMLTAAEPSLDRIGTQGHDKEHATAAYAELVDALHLTTPETRGSGTATTVAALALAGALREHPAQAAQIAASILDTDTDTIATMACSLVGAAVPTALTSPVQDEEYLIAESDRLTQVSLGENVRGFPYPDLLKWRAPKSALDCVGVVDGEPELAGLGRLSPSNDGVSGEYAAGDAVWRWVRTSFGPSMLIKARVKPSELPSGNIAMPRRNGTTQVEDLAPSNSTSGQLPLTENRRQRDPAVSSRPLDLNEVTQWVRRNRFSDKALGYAIRRVSQAGSARQMDDFVAFVRAELKDPKA